MLSIGVAVFGDPHALQDGAIATLRPVGTAYVAHAFALGQEQRDPSLRGLRHALDQRPIMLAGLPGPEDLAEFGGHLATAGHQEHARCVAVEPMHQQRPVPIPVREAVEHSVDMKGRARTALDREAVGLVQHHDVAILVEHHGLDGPAIVIGGLCALDLGRGKIADPQRRDPDGLARSDACGRLGPGAIEAHLSGAHDLVQMAKGEFGVSALEPAVEAHAVLVLRYHQGLDTHRRLRSPGERTDPIEPRCAATGLGLRPMGEGTGLHGDGTTWRSEAPDASLFRRRRIAGRLVVGSSLRRRGRR